MVKKRGQKEYSRWKLNVSISSLSLCENKPIKLWNKSAVNTPSIKRVPLSEEHAPVDRRLVTLRNIYKLKPLLCLLFSLADMPIYSVIGSILEGPGGILRYRSDGSARRTISRTPPKGTRILFYRRVPNSFPSLRGTNSTTGNYITGTANFNTNKDNFRTLSI